MLTLWNAFDDKFFDDVLRRAPVQGPPSFQPAVDVVESEKAYELTAELPGMKPEEVEVSVDSNVLTLKGERRYEHKDEKKGYTRIERRYGSFQRSFSLPETVNSEAIEAHMEEGVLKLRVPKMETKAPKKIAIGGAKKLFGKTG
jgi:HSP20 family protein